MKTVILEKEATSIACTHVGDFNYYLCHKGYYVSKDDFIATIAYISKSQQMFTVCNVFYITVGDALAGYTDEMLHKVCIKLITNGWSVYEFNNPVEFYSTIAKALELINNQQNVNLAFINNKVVEENKVRNISLQL